MQRKNEGALHLRLSAQALAQSLQTLAHCLQHSALCLEHSRAHAPQTFSHRTHASCARSDLDSVSSPHTRHIRWQVVHMREHSGRPSSLQHLAQVSHSLAHFLQAAMQLSAGTLFEAGAACGKKVTARRTNDTVNGWFMSGYSLRAEQVTTLPLIRVATRIPDHSTAGRKARPSLSWTDAPTPCGQHRQYE